MFHTAAYTAFKHISEYLDLAAVEQFEITRVLFTKYFTEWRRKRQSSVTRQKDNKGMLETQNKRMYTKTNMSFLSSDTDQISLKFLQVLIRI